MTILKMFLGGFTILEESKSRNIEELETLNPRGIETSKKPKLHTKITLNSKVNSTLN